MSWSTFFSLGHLFKKLLGEKNSNQSRPPKSAEPTRGSGTGERGDRPTGARAPSATESRRRGSGRELGSPAEPAGPAEARAAGSHARVTRRHRGAPYFHRSGSQPGDYVRPSTPPPLGQGWCPQSSPRPAAGTYHPAGTRQVDPGGHTLPAASDPLRSLLRVRARLCARACCRAPSYLPREVTICTHPGQRKYGFGRARIPRGGVPI